MGSEPETPRNPSLGLSRKVRFLCWSTLYLTGFLVVLDGMWQPGLLSSLRGWLGCVAFVFLFAPLGLFNASLYLAGDPTAKATQEIIGILCLGFYPFHLLLSLLLRGKIIFYILMLLLVIALTISWIGVLKVDAWRLTRNGGFHEITPAPHNP